MCTRRRGADIGPDPQFVQPRENPPERTGGLCPRATSSSSYIFFAFFFFLPFVVAFAIAALGPVAAIGAVASDPDFATAPPLVPLAPPVCAIAPAADNANAMAATGMISTRIIILPFKCVPVPKTVCSNRSDASKFRGEGQLVSQGSVEPKAQDDVVSGRTILKCAAEGYPPRLLTGCTEPEVGGNHCPAACGRTSRAFGAVDTWEKWHICHADESP